MMEGQLEVSLSFLGWILSPRVHENSPQCLDPVPSRVQGNCQRYNENYVDPDFATRVKADKI
jgi:hypothetical protein